MTDPLEKLLLRPDEVADMLGVSRSQLYKLHSSGRFPLPVRLGRSTRWRKRELIEWTDAGCPSRAQWEAQKAAMEK